MVARDKTDFSYHEGLTCQVHKRKRSSFHKLTQISRKVAPNLLSFYMRQGLSVGFIFYWSRIYGLE